MSKLVDIIEKPISGEWGTDDESDNGIPVLRTTNFTNIGEINYASVVTRNISREKAKNKFLKNGDIIIEKSGGSPAQPVGRVVYYVGRPDVYLCNNFTSVLRIRNEKQVCSRYLFYVLFAGYRLGITKKFQNKTTGILNLKLDSYINDIDVPLPTLDEQRKIAAKLDAATELLKLRKEQLAELDKLVKSQFIEMFGDPVTNPMGWPMVPLLETGTCKNGMNFGSGETGVAIHCLGVGDFKDLSVIEAAQKLPTISLNQMPTTEYLLRDEDIVFVRSNGNSALVGRCLAIYPGNTPTTFSGFCIRYRKNTDSLLTEYLLQTFKAPSIRQQMFGRGANIQNLNQQILSQLNIPVPPLTLQNGFVDFVQQVDKSKFVIQQSIDETQHLFDSLMSEYFE